MPATTRQIRVGFLSYAHADDHGDSGRLTEFRIRLEREIRVQTGTVFSIFQDRQDIRWGDAWRDRIESSIDAATFLIPIITPSFFLSRQCRYEFERFLLREEQLNRKNLIFPVYYVNCRPVEEGEDSADPLARTIHGRQYTDWRELRFDNFDSPTVARKIAELARALGEAAALYQEMPPEVADEDADSLFPKAISQGAILSLPGPPGISSPPGLPSISDITRGTGLIGIFPSFDECQAEVLREMRESRSIKIFVQMGKSVLSGAAIIYEALEHTRKDAEVKILHAGMESPYLSERVALNRDSDYQEWRDDINYVIRVGGRLQGRLGARLELRRHSEGYIWRFFLFDDHAYLQPYLFPRHNARLAPVLKFSRLDTGDNPTGSEVNANSLQHMLQNYFDLKWEECAPEATRLNDMITPGDPTAVAALVKRAGVWVFVVPKRFLDLPGGELPFHNIGGKRNFNEEWVDALQREAMEEIGTELNVKSSSSTRDITTSAEFEHMALSDDPRPYCVYKRTRDIDPKVEPEILWIVGYEAELPASLAIEPRAEIAAVVSLSASMLRRTARERITYDQIRRAKDGSSVIVQAGVDFDFQRAAVPAGLAALPTFESK